MSLRTTYQKHKNIFFCVFIVLISCAAFYLLKYVGDAEADNSLSNYLIADSKIEKTINEFKPTKILGKKKLHLLQNQYEIIKYKKAVHLSITKMMNAYYFAASIVLLVLSVIRGILFIQVANTGIKEKSPLFRSIFFTTLSLVTFFGLLIQVLNHKENINGNKKAFLDYSSVQLRIYNYIITDGKELSAKRKDTLNFNQFVTSINRGINKTNTIAFEITHENIKPPNDIIDYEK